MSLYPTFLFLSSLHFCVCCICVPCPYFIDNIYNLGGYQGDSEQDKVLGNAPTLTLYGKAVTFTLYRVGYELNLPYLIGYWKNFFHPEGYMGKIGKIFILF